MNVVVAMAWRPQPARIAVHDHCVAWWATVLPDAELLEVDTDHHPYNLAAVRNEAVHEAGARGADVVILTDADSVLAPVRALRSAIATAPLDGKLHLPFTEQRYLNQAETEALLDGGMVPLAGGHGNGACYVVTPAAYWKCGGSDERFRGWGGDDDGLVAAAATLIGVERHPGTVLSLWHADERRPVATPEHRPNAELAARYWEALDDPAAMRALIAERDAA